MAPASTATQRNLRLLTLFGSTIALPLLVAVTIIGQNYARWGRWGYYGHYRAVTAFPFAFIPLIVSCTAVFISIVHQRRKGTLPGPLFGLLDATAIAFYLATLIPIWAVEVGQFRAPGHALLLGYTTAPMIVNMFAHMLLFYKTMKPTWIALKQTLDGTFSRECPHCGHGSTSSENATSGPSGYSFLRGELYLDEDATPRQSSDLAAAAAASGAKDDFNADAALKV